MSLPKVFRKKQQFFPFSPAKRRSKRKMKVKKIILLRKESDCFRISIIESSPELILLFKFSFIKQLKKALNIFMKILFQKQISMEKF